MHIVFACIVGFLSGSILWSYFLGQLFYDVDIRNFGLDRNPGAMNAFRAKGFWLGASGELLDALKGFLPASKHKRASAAVVLDAPSVGALYGFCIAHCGNLKWKAGSALSLLGQEK